MMFLDYYQGVGIRLKMNDDVCEDLQVTIKKYLITSDKYLFVLKEYAYFFNKFWSDKEEVIVLCYKKPDFDLPNNFKIQSLGKQPAGRIWTNPLIPYFKNVKDECFIILLEDLFLINNVNIKLLNEMKDLVLQGKAQKACLFKIVPTKYRGKMVSDNIVEVNSLSGFRTTINPAIWNKNHFLKYLKPDLTIWQLEQSNVRLARSEKAVVVGPTNTTVFPQIGLLRGGKIDNKAIKVIKRCINNGLIDKEYENIVIKYGMENGK